MYNNVKMIFYNCVIKVLVVKIIKKGKSKNRICSKSPAIWKSRNNIFCVVPQSTKVRELFDIV